MVTVAVDRAGRTWAPEVGARAALPARTGPRVILSGPAPEIGVVPPGVEVVDPGLDRQGCRPSVRRSLHSRGFDRAGRQGGRGRARAGAGWGARPARPSPRRPFNIRRDRGIHRPALALPLPVPAAPPVLSLDVGANVTCRPEHLVEFAHMGSAFAQAVLGLASPRAALLSNGEEPAKSTF